ncbi:hypothetical protein F4780DRAFT_191042 [Xylariomycetidae sp. FL0641]|nr:hypothetical protein F4780DRAFT_191042 [Xylariomycetidae sp. FL0641]
MSHSAELLDSHLQRSTIVCLYDNGYLPYIYLESVRPRQPQPRGLARTHHHRTTRTGRAAQRTRTHAHATDNRSTTPPTMWPPILLCLFLVVRLVDRNLDYPTRAVALPRFADFLLEGACLLPSTPPGRFLGGALDGLGYLLVPALTLDPRPRPAAHLRRGGGVGDPPRLAEEARRRARDGAVLLAVIAVLGAIPAAAAAWGWAASAYNGWLLPWLGFGSATPAGCGWDQALHGAGVLEKACRPTFRHLVSGGKIQRLPFDCIRTLER